MFTVLIKYIWLQLEALMLSFFQKKYNFKKSNQY